MMVNAECVEDEDGEVSGGDDAWEEEKGKIAWIMACNFQIIMMIILNHEQNYFY